MFSHRSLTRDRLAPEGLALRNFEVMAKLQVVGKVEGMGNCYISKAFEEVHLEQSVLPH